MEQKYADIIKLGTSALSDAMDRLGIAGQALGIKPVDRSFLVCGPAFTVHNMPCDIHGGSVGDYIDDVAAGQVICIDNAGRLDATVWGDILTIMGSLHNIGGTVINGVCRDSTAPWRSATRSSAAAPTCAPARTASWPTPTTPRSRWARSRSSRATSSPVTSTASSSSRRSASTRSSAAAIEIEDAEDHIRESIRKGMSLIDARTQFNYHALQSRR